MLHCSEISPDIIKAQTRLPACATSACSFADSNKCPEHSCINFTLLHLNWFILHLLPAQGKSISQAIIFIYCMYQEYYKHCKKPRDEKQADVTRLHSCFSPTHFSLLIPTYNHIPELSDRLQFSGGPAMLCDKIWPWWDKWREAIFLNTIFTFKIHHVRYFFTICWELTSRKKGKEKSPQTSGGFLTSGFTASVLL